MNLVTVRVVKVIDPPYFKNGKWRTLVITNCWGSEKRMLIVSEDPSEVEMYKKGYSWKE